MKLLSWKIYETTSTNDLQGIKFRGRLRKFCLEQNINLLTENDEKNQKIVRFALINHDDKSIHTLEFEIIRGFLFKDIDTEIEIRHIGDFENPVLSKLDVNNVDRYSI